MIAFPIGEYLIEKMNDGTYKMYFQDKFLGKMQTIIIPDLTYYFEKQVNDNYYNRVYDFVRLFEKAFGSPESMTDFVNNDDRCAMLVNAIPVNFNNILPGQLATSELKLRYHCHAWVSAYNNVYGTELNWEDLLPYVRHVDF